VKILLGDFNAKVGREDIFKPIIGQESLHQDSNDNGVRIVNFATSKNLVVKITMFPHRNIHKYTWTSPDGKTHNQIDHLNFTLRIIYSNYLPNTICTNFRSHFLIPCSRRTSRYTRMAPVTDEFAVQPG
jgi:hypothetical protein